MAKFKARQKGEKKRLSTAMVIAIVVIMVLSTAGFLLSYNSGANPDVYEYNGFKLVRTQSGWQTSLKTGPAYFYYDPSVAYSINISPEAASVIKDKPLLYLTSNHNSSLAAEIASVQYDISLLLFTHYDQYAITGFTEKNPFNLTVISCDNATAFTPVIMFERSNSTSIRAENNCVIVEAASSYDLFLARDRLLYAVFGII